LIFEATKIITLYICTECVQTVVEFRLKVKTKYRSRFNRL